MISFYFCTFVRGRNIILGLAIIIRNINCALLTVIDLFGLEKAHSNLFESCMPWGLGANMGIQPSSFPENGLD